MAMIMTDPRKNFGEARLQNVCPTILSTDYKSPKLVIEIEIAQSWPAFHFLLMSVTLFTLSQQEQATSA